MSISESEKAASWIPAVGRHILLLLLQCYLLVVRTESRAGLGFATSGADTDKSMDGGSVSNSTRANQMRPVYWPA